MTVAAGERTSTGPRVLGALFVTITVLSLMYPAAAAGQTSALRPRDTLVRAGPEPLHPLKRLVTLNVVGVPLREVLAAISEQADLGLVYGSDVVPIDRRIDLHLSAIPAGQALRIALAGTDVEIETPNPRQVLLVKRRDSESAKPVVQAGRVAGRITDAATGQGIQAVDVWLDGTRLRTLTEEDGRFMLTGVGAGTYTLRVRRIGYASASRQVTVTAGETTVVDLTLQSVPTPLDAIVATVTGRHRAREMGHSTSRINVDSLTREAPISSVTEALTGRVPGLQIFNTSGMLGGEVNVQIRSTNSLRLSNAPTVIIDGIRYTSHNGDGTTRTLGPPLGAGFEPTSRLNDLNPNDIESIEVVRGPSASTLYGTDASNGVIVITTKSGRPGPARWNAYVRAGMTDIPKLRMPDSYWGWGSASASCTLRLQGLGTCTQDSVTVIRNPLNDPQLTIFGAKPRWQYGASVSGGTDALSYYVSADLERAVGPMRMPPFIAEQLDERLGKGGLTKSYLEPNAYDKLSLRTNVVAKAGERARLRVNINYVQSETRQVNMANPFNVGITEVSPNGEPYGTWFHPSRVFAQTSEETIERLTGNVRLEWEPAPWLSTHATVGLDMPGSHRYNLVRQGAWEDYDGSVGEDRVRSKLVTGEVGATASYHWKELSFRTSIGSQYVHNNRNTVIVSGANLRPGGSSIIDAATIEAGHHYYEAVTLGSYVEQVVGLRDRLFVTGAVRADGASTFGSSYKAAFYPKAGVSWVLSEEPFMPRLPWLTDLRLRYAFGASGQQPTPGMRNIGLQQAARFVDGRDQPAINLARFGNPNLRPERVKEHEAGVDITAFDGRLGLEMSTFRRRTVDQINNITLPASFGFYWTNIGLVTGRGTEVRLDARILESPLLTWDLALSQATQNNTIEDLGGVAPTYRASGSSVEGFPIGARFMRPLLGYEDRNGDGRIDLDELQMGDTAVYVGRSTPGRIRALTTTLGFFQQQVRLSALFEHRGDFIQYNLIRENLRHVARDAVDPTTPLARQAEMMATYAGAAPGQPGTDYTFNEPGDFTRLRELTLAYSVPRAVTRTVGLDRATVSLSGRNLALWTKYSGPDPESIRLNGPFGGRADAVPQSRYWVVRVDVGF